MLCGVCCLLIGVCPLMCVGGCSLFVDDCALCVVFVARPSLFRVWSCVVVGGLLFEVFCLLVAACCLAFVVCSALFVMNYGMGIVCVVCCV